MCMPPGWCRCFTLCLPQDVEAAMRLPLAFAVLLLASARTLAEEMGASDDLSYWSDWSDGDQAKVGSGGLCAARGPVSGAAGTPRALGVAGEGGVRAERQPLSPRRTSCRCRWSTSFRGWPGDPGPSSSSASWASAMLVSSAVRVEGSVLSPHMSLLLVPPQTLQRLPLGFSVINLSPKVPCRVFG